ncbi:hypothetical protein BGZ63DRAFT_211457 [Mariannaea sp. PMI_226]|nr:hypothetical protein BGZ63DRAFT_211457 [Mariannaea sp. PMI_226]
MTHFYSSQVGEASVIDYTHTDPPRVLFIKDIYYFFVYIWALPWVVWPISTSGPKEFNELSLTRQNLFCISIHTILIILQLLFLLSLPFLIVFPIWTVAIGVAAFMTVNWALCRVLNGSEEVYYSDEKYAPSLPEHENEQWVFLNGVSVGQHWMKGNLNRLALTFGRPVLGIHNQTSGIVFDIIECLVQRNYGYATSDIRTCFRILKKVLYDPSKSKVVFIAHSQGGIEGSLVLDWLLQELPQDLLSKLEVYTFGNAANHFNNPHRHAASEALNKKSTPLSSTINQPIAITSATGSEEKRGIKVHIAKHPNGPTSADSFTRSAAAAKDRAITHIEHYAHSTDFVAMWGVLHFATNKMRSPQFPRFIGRLFSRSDGHGGHQLNQHYLDGMFPLKYDEQKKRYIGADEDNEFMNEIIKLGKEGDAMENAREAFELSWAGTRGFGTGEITTPVEVHNISPTMSKSDDSFRVKDFSRLWCYRNGRKPDENPPLLATENGVPRVATL